VPGVQGIPLKAFSNWRAKFKAEPPPQPLIQVDTLLRFVMRSPERIALTCP
jgi:hypothetical protein